MPIKAVWKEFLKIKTHLHLTAYNSWAEWVNLLKALIILGYLFVPRTMQDLSLKVK